MSFFVVQKMKTLFLASIIATSLLGAAEPRDKATFKGQHPNLRELDVATMGNIMGIVVPFADSFYEDKRIEQSIKRWYVVVDDKIIAHYIEIVTLLPKEQADRVVDSDLSAQGLKLISSKVGSTIMGDKVPSGHSKYLYFYGVSGLIDKARAVYERKQREIEETEISRIRRLLNAQQDAPSNR